MAKTKTKVQFLCNHCGSVHPKWMGKCPDCGTWDACEEYKAPTPDARADGAAGPAAVGADRRSDPRRRGRAVGRDR